MYQNNCKQTNSAHKRIERHPTLRFNGMIGRARSQQSITRYFKGSILYIVYVLHERSLAEEEGQAAGTSGIMTHSYVSGHRYA
jgi:hypothetical protein